LKTKTTKRKSTAGGNIGRHESQCSICQHPRREDLEAAFIGWEKPSRIVKAFKISRDALYRHAGAFKLDEKKCRNKRVALVRIIDNYDGKPANAFAIVAAVTALAKIDSRGNWQERMEVADVGAVLMRMTDAELETYSTTGIPPKWAEKVLSPGNQAATPDERVEGEDIEKEA
jgi:hypothetical protein